LDHAISAIAELGIDMSHYSKIVPEEYSRMGPKPKMEEAHESKGGMTPVYIASDSDGPDSP
jgi:hypothetical protein